MTLGNYNFLAYKQYNMLWLNPADGKLSKYETAIRKVELGISQYLGEKHYACTCNLLPQYHTAGKLTK